MNSILGAGGHQQVADGQSYNKMKTVGIDSWLRVMCGPSFMGDGRAAQSMLGSLTGF